MVFLFSIYRIFFTSGKFFINDKVEAQDITEIKADNYTNILEAVHEDLNSYVGLRIKFSGYIYRLLDFDQNQFVLARNMVIDEGGTQTVVVGFLCNSKKAKDFENEDWVEITGVIQKGKYHNQEIPIIEIDEIKKVDEPEESFVPAPCDTYIPTSGIL